MTYAERADRLDSSSITVRCLCLFQLLRDWVAIESDSSNILKRPELHRMMEMAAQKLRQMGGTVELVDIGEQEVSVPAVPSCLFRYYNVCMYIIITLIGW